MDQLDTLLIRALRDHPRVGFLELSRQTGVSRATVQARIQRLETAEVITGYGPDVNLAAAGYPVLAFVNLQIAQGGLHAAADELAQIPEVLDAYGTTGDADIHCRVAARSHQHLQEALVRINHIPVVVRSTSVMALSEVVAPRILPLLESEQRPRPSRVPAYRRPS
ncbi:Lrp/AsnC family transcriptional regulator [Streptomyces sp. BV286]|uniref:Lrp/AsnC family transcriptional regulator n=1 Tax=Streptomyces sp. BV286 TaxID=2849672 RepID=UPI001C2E9512|nr:Lrp/AsnC family transcriptional regulator [Streptomyces sp. BV286]MBV1940445.1 Lrp/AsnC family transcriptional regulator [Streptomyces sp. BV286]